MGTMSSVFINIHIIQSLNRFIYSTSFFFRRTEEDYANKIEFFNFDSNIYSFQVFVNSEGKYYYYVLVSKNRELISIDVSFQIVKVCNFFGIRISACKINQLVPKEIFLTFLNQFVVHLNSSQRDGKYF